MSGWLEVLLARTLFWRGHWLSDDLGGSSNAGESSWALIQLYNPV